MIRPSLWPVCALAWSLALAAGCHPTQPFYFGERGELSHYVDVATHIEEPDVQPSRLAEVESSASPMTVSHTDFDTVWDLRLEEAIQITLSNSDIFRTLGGRVGQAGGPPETLLRNGNSLPTSYDAAIQETAPGNSNLVRSAAAGTGQGAEAALSEFDAEFSMSAVWNQNDRPVNVQQGQLSSIFQQVIQQDQTTFQAQLSKFNAMGGRSAVRHNVVYDSNNNPTREVFSDYNVNFEFEVRQPLLQGYGAEFNRIFGPSSDSIRDIGSGRGVSLARINTDITLIQMETGLRDLVGEVEDAYWELYFAYKNLDTQKRGRAETRNVWDELISKFQIQGGESYQEARARGQYFDFDARVKQALASLYTSERRLRFLMGISPADRRLIRPVDEPASALVQFDYPTVAGEALARSPELREQKWRIRANEMQLTASKNFLLPRLDAVALYRFVGLGDDLISTKRTPGDNIPAANAWQSLTSGRFQEWTMGMQFEMPIGFRRALANVRHRQLGLIRDRKLFQEQELELVYQIQESLADVDRAYSVAESNFNNVAAVSSQIKGLRALPGSGFQRFDVFVLLNAYLELAQAEQSYYRSLADYNRALKDIHLRKGSLLEYNGITLAEGPWPDKAYYDAFGEARKRDAAHFVNYGFTQPSVTSRGPIRQSWGTAASPSYTSGSIGTVFSSPTTETVPTPAPTEPDMPKSDELPPPEKKSTPNDTARVPTSRAAGNNARAVGKSARAASRTVQSSAVGDISDNSRSERAASPPGPAYEWGELPLSEDHADSELTAAVYTR